MEHQIFRFGKVILRDRCSTSYDLASLFRGTRNTLDTWTGKIAKRIGTRRSALHSTYQLSIFEGSLAELLRFSCCHLRKFEEVSPSGRIAKIEEILQNCCVLDIVKFKS